MRVAVQSNGNGEAFVAAPGIAEAEQFEAVEERRDRGLRRRLQHDRKEARGAGKVALPKLMARMIGQGGVDDAQDLRAGGEPLRERQAPAAPPRAA